MSALGFEKKSETNNVTNPTKISIMLSIPIINAKEKCINSVDEYSLKYNNSNSNKKTISIPIPIPNTKSHESDLCQLEEYSLTCNNFDPGKMSPPDTWKSRLQQRLKEHYTLVNCNE